MSLSYAANRLDLAAYLFAKQKFMKLNNLCKPSFNTSYISMKTRNLMYKFKRYAFIIIPILLTNGILVRMLSRGPFKQGDPPVFWKIACDIELPNYKGLPFKYAYNWGIFPSLGDSYFFWQQEHHGDHIYRVSKEAIIASTGPARSLLGANGTERCIRLSKLAASDAEFLNGLTSESEVIASMTSDDRMINGQRSEVVIGESSDQFGKRLKNFTLRVAQANWFWVTGVFEFVFLTFWWIFFLYGFRENLSTRKRALQIGLGPFILLVPHFCGYAPLMFSHGPSGGLVYPVVVILVGFPALLIDLALQSINCIQIESVLWSLFPNFLSPLNLNNGKPLAVSFIGGIGPFAILLTGAIYGGVYYFAKSCCSRK